VRVTKDLMGKRTAGAQAQSAFSVMPPSNRQVITAHFIIHGEEREAPSFPRSGSIRHGRTVTTSC
jgi:hypothetical protein